MTERQPEAPALPRLPVAAAFDRESLRELIMTAVVRKDGPPPGERITDVILPLLEHAQSAAAGSHEGVRLWMLDCGELAARHRKRAEAAEAKLEAAEARLAAIDGIISSAGVRADPDRAHLMIRRIRAVIAGGGPDHA